MNAIEKVEVGYQTFVADEDEEFGAVREVSPDGLLVPHEFFGLFRRLEANPAEREAMRRAGRSTAELYAWPEIIERLFLPRLDLLRYCAQEAHAV